MVRRSVPYHSASSVCVTPFLYAIAARSRYVGLFPSTLSRASWRSSTGISSRWSIAYTYGIWVESSNDYYIFNERSVTLFHERCYLPRCFHSHLFGHGDWRVCYRVCSAIATVSLVDNSVSIDSAPACDGAITSSAILNISSLSTSGSNS